VFASVSSRGDIVTVGKNAVRQRSDIMKPIGAADSHPTDVAGACLLANAARAQRPSKRRRDPRRFQSLLEDEVNPAVERHGGKISLVDVKGAVVYITMSGGCQGCGQRA